MTAPLTAQTMGDIVTPQEAAKISGLDYMLAILHGEFPATPISQIMNFNLIDVTSGRVVFRDSPSFSALNPVGTVLAGGMELYLTVLWRALFQPKLTPDLLPQL